MLNDAEKLLPTASDSALLILEALLPDYEHLPAEDKARFGLLYFEARDKNYETLPSADIIDFSIHYFTDEKNNALLAKSLFYKSRIYKYDYKFEEAIPLLLKALRFADNTDYGLLGRIYSDLGYAAYYLNKLDEAHKYDLEALHYIEKTKNNNNIAIVLLGIVSNLSSTEKYESALHYAQKAFDMATDSIIIGKTMNNIGYIYFTLQQYDSATHYMKKGLSYFHNEKHLEAQPHLNLANVFQKQKQYDSALYYLSVAIDYPMDYYDKRNYYASLTELYSAMGKSDSALHYSLKHALYNDSINMIEAQPAVSLLKEMSDKEMIIAQKEKNTKNLFIAILLLVASFIFCTILQYKCSLKKQATKEMLYKQKLERKQSLLQQEMMSRINNELKKMPAGKYKKDMQEREQMIVAVYKEELQYDNYELFFEKMNRLFNQLPQALIENYPNVNYDGIMLCCFILLDIPMENMALLLNVQRDSIRKQKQRMAKKLGLSTSSELDDFLQTFR